MDGQKREKEKKNGLIGYWWLAMANIHNGLTEPNDDDDADDDIATSSMVAPSILNGLASQMGLHHHLRCDTLNLKTI